MEVLVSLSIFLLILMAIYQTFDTSQATFASGQKRVDVQESTRSAMDEMVKRIRMAGYFPENFATPPPTPPLANPIQVATTGALAIYGDLDGSGASNVFFFCLNGTSLQRGRGAQGVGASYNCSQGDVLADNITRLVFTYYDANNSQITGNLDGQTLNGAVPDFTSTAQRGAVQTIVVTLTAREAVGIAGKEPQDFTLSSSVRLRNRN